MLTKVWWPKLLEMGFKYGIRNDMVNLVHEMVGWVKTYIRMVLWWFGGL